MKISITGKGSLGSLLEKLCWVLLFAGLVIVAALPWILDYYGSLFWQDLGTDYIRILLVLYMSLIHIWIPPHNKALPQTSAAAESYR